MTRFSVLRRLWPFRRKRKAAPNQPATRPLREFVYLDEVSLRSLLSSQTGGVTDSTSRETRSSIEAELGSRVEAGAPTIAKSEVSSRFQTSNSSSIQTLRKATVQSWFAELLAVANLRKIKPVSEAYRAEDLADIRLQPDPSLAVAASGLLRGDVIEFEATLEADPVFRLGTMATEFAGMAEDFPDMFGTAETLGHLRAMLPANKILQRLLAGLIPVRGQARDHVVIEIEGEDYVVHRKLIEGHKIETRPLELVGVTEHLAYWKDIRRVLFSDGVFTILARISRPGLHDSWTPVKLADLFSQIAPGLVAQISSASRMPMTTAGGETPQVSKADLNLETALKLYAKELFDHAGKVPTKAQMPMLDQLCEARRDRSASVSDQRTAFRQVRDRVSELISLELSAEADLRLRTTAREQAGLSLFPTAQAATISRPAASPDGPRSRLLDVEIIAVYW